MEEVKKWSVTYTKHINQKRKVYQDGVLELHCSNGTDKVLLFDESEKLLGSKFLKKGELVGSGETLSFDGYLVDIGDLEKHCNASSDLDLEEIKKPTPNFGQLRDNGMRGFRNNVRFVRHIIKKENEKNSLGKNVVLTNRPSLRYNIKKENDTSFSRNRTTLENHPSETNNIRSEWRALYTSQKTQKSKKYHDGVVRLVVGVFDRKQILLFDDSGKQLDSRFLKKDEVVARGATLTFDGYFVDVGDFEENCKPVLDFNIQGAPKIPKENIGGLDECKKGGSVNNVAPESFSRSSVTHNVKREWDALYTTQKTQKAKMYHDGTLQLLVGVSHRKQVILLNEDGTVLSSRYLSSSEDIRTGSKLELANHLVEIGEAKNSEEGDTENSCTSVLGAASCSTISYVDRTKINSSGTRPYEPLSNSSSGKTLSSYPTSVTVEKDKFSRSGIRDVNQILSSLKRPVGASIFPVKEPDNLENLIIGGADQDVRHRSEVSQSEDIEELSTSCLENGGEQQQPKPSSGISFGLTESNHPTSQTVVQSTMKPVSSMGQPQVSDGLDMPEQLQNLNKLVPSDEFEVLDGNSIQDAPGGNTKQFSADKMQTETNCQRVDLGLLSSIGSGSCSNGADKENSKVFTEEVKERAHLKDFPSFDLGFSP